jgi:hypothetical protein
MLNCLRVVTVRHGNAPDIDYQALRIGPSGLLSVASRSIPGNRR